MFVTTIGFFFWAWDLEKTLESIAERSRSRLKFIRGQLWYKLLCHELVNPRIKICPFSGFVCDLLLRTRRGLSLKAHCQKSILFHNRDVHSLEDTGVTLCLSYPSHRPSGGAPFFGRYVSWSLVIQTYLWGLVSPRMHARPQTL